MNSAPNFLQSISTVGLFNRQIIPKLIQINNHKHFHLKPLPAWMIYITN